jgi:hypothetical protein
VGGAICRAGGGQRRPRESAGTTSLLERYGDQVVVLAPGSAQRSENGSATRLTSEEKKELAELRREKRRLEVEKEILKRAAAYFARENILPQ